MPKLTCVAILNCALLLAAADAPKQPDPPDRKAYTEAVKIEDPGARAAALEKFLAEFPKSGSANAARTAVLDALLKMPQKDEQRIAQIVKSITGKSKDRSTANSVAAKLADAGVLLDQAEKLATKALKSFDQKKYIAAEQKYAAKAKRKPSEEVALRRFRTDRAGPLATLGKVYLKKGDVDKAEAVLKEAFDARSAAAAATLSEIAEKKGDNAAALDYIVRARIGLRMPAGAAERLQTLYRKQHNGSLDGLEELLDGTYAKLYPPPVHAEPYKAGPKRSDRVVLLEVFTGAGCPPCVGADLAFDAVLERYSTADVAVIMNHQHIPRPDPLSNPDTIARAKAMGVQGVPTFLIDGKKTLGGGDRDDAAEIWDSVRTEIEKRLETPADARIVINAARAGSVVTAGITVDKVNAGDGPFKLHVALVELKQRYSGENGIRFHPMVVRALAGPEGAGFALDPAKPNRFDVTFDAAKIAVAIKAHLDDFEVNNTRFGKIRFIEKKHEIDPANLAVAAFVQDEKKNNVLQAVFTKVQ